MEKRALMKQNDFEELYEKTYPMVLKYMICKCQNLEDVNELVQDTYVEFYQVLEKKPFLKMKDETAYLMGIAKNMVCHYYRNCYQEKSKICYFSKEEAEKFLFDESDLEADFIQQENIAEIWQYLNQNDVFIAKIFYLYYAMDLKLAEISEMLEINQSTVKNYIYRTLKELKSFFGKEKKEDET